MLAGWSSGSKYPLLGSVRASAQMVCYEAALGLSVVTVVLVSGTLSTHGIVVGQDGFRQLELHRHRLRAALVFLLAVTAEMNRPPFDLVEAEQELVGGFNTEYSVDPLRDLLPGRVHEHVTMSAIIVTLFLGGPPGPVRHPGLPNWIWGTLWFLAKLLLFLFIFVWFRATLPRFRYDQLMDLGWKVLIPLALGWLLLIAALQVAQDEDWNRVLVGVIAVVVAAAGCGLLTLALRRQRPPARAGGESVLMGYLDGFVVTLKQMRAFGGQRVTTEYSGGLEKGPDGNSRHDQKIPKPERLHGRHVLNRYEDGMEKCIGCELCAGVCPARCIYVRGADNPADDPVSPGERYGFVYEINYLRCIHCDLCVEACPTEAITETKLFEFSFTNRQRRDLHQGRAAGRRRRHAPAAAVGGLARGRRPAHLGAGCGPRRRRATPTSRASVAWSGELGYGVDGPTRARADDRPTDGSRRLRRRRRHRARRRARRRAPRATPCTPRSAWCHAVRHRRAVRRPGRPLPRRGAGDRLRRRHRRAVPVRDHAARRRPGRGPRDRAAGVASGRAAAIGGIGLLGLARHRAVLTAGDRHRHAARSRSVGTLSSRSSPTSCSLGEVAVHRLPVRVRDHLGAAGDRGGRRGRAALAAAARGRRREDADEDADGGRAQ